AGAEAPSLFYLQVSPTPFSEQLRADFALPEGKARVQARLLNLYGLPMAERALREVAANQRHRFTFDGEGLPNGIYLLQLLADGELLGVRKAVKAN
ncbi:MAG: hypothetical protein KDD09_26405, partial [Phaeodactylibacter sp.]|nr:hypothetical protein [Phaeodactylibacter sp.]